MKRDFYYRKNVVSKIKKISIAVFLLLCIGFVKKIFTSNIATIEDFQRMMNSYGVLGPIVLTLIQAFQVIIPILPGYLGCAVGAISYGTVIGFICNYIGISIGSFIAFLLASRFGRNIVIEIFSEKMYDKWANRIAEQKSYNIFLFIATLLPLFPDDFLCYFSGLIHMNRKQFIWIIILGKPWCILAYSIIFGLIN